MKKGKAGWVLGIILAGALCLFIFVMLLGANGTNNSNEGAAMSTAEMSARCYRASELYCASLYYTDKALTADPGAVEYTAWRGYVDTAYGYMDALEYELDLIEGYAQTEGFQKNFEKTERREFTLLPAAYAYDSAEIIRAYDGGKAGHKLQAVANLLGKDLKYAYQALQVADGEITAQSWNDYGDTAMHIEQGLRAAKTAGQGAALYVGAATGGASTALGEAACAVSGAGLIWQATDDGAFILMGDDYQSSEFVANLGKVSDFVAPIAFAGDMLTMDFSGGTDAILSSLTVAETLRGLFQDGKIAGIQLRGDGGKITSLTKEELMDYRLAKENGQALPAEIEALLAVLDGDQGGPGDLPEITVVADKNPIAVEEWVTFIVEDANPDYTYVWEYGGNKNPQNTNTFQYMYQKAGTYTMKVTVLNKEGEPIGKGSCSVDVIDTPGPDGTPEPTQDQRTASGGTAQFAGTWVYLGRAQSYGQVPEDRELSWNRQATLLIESDGSYALTTLQPHYENGQTVNGQYDPFVSTGVIEEGDGGYYGGGPRWTNGEVTLHENGYLYIEVGEDGDVIYQVFSRGN